LLIICLFLFIFHLIAPLFSVFVDNFSVKSICATAPQTSGFNEEGGGPPKLIFSQVIIFQDMIRLSNIVLG